MKRSKVDKVKLTSCSNRYEVHLSRKKSFDCFDAAVTVALIFAATAFPVITASVMPVASVTVAAANVMPVAAIPVVASSTVVSVADFTVYVFTAGNYKQIIGQCSEPV